VAGVVGAVVLWGAVVGGIVVVGAVVGVVTGAVVVEPLGIGVVAGLFFWLAYTTKISNNTPRTMRTVRPLPEVSAFSLSIGLGAPVSFIDLP